MTLLYSIESLTLNHVNVVEDCLFDFEISIGVSSVPNAGNGAFITFLGMRELKSECKDRRTDKWEKLDIQVEGVGGMPSQDFSRPINFSTPAGHGAALSLLPASLHRNNGSMYWPRTMTPLPASNKVKVFLNGVNLHYDDGDEPVNTTPSKRFGFLGMLNERDYVRSPAKEASFPKNSCIEIGRYGPFRKEDRKTEDQFDFKSFIFDYEPDAWGKWLCVLCGSS